jgi:CDP-4-dehydro-6-deoxyglucose reductase
MTRLLSVSRAARLVGITRGALQKRIRQGDLHSFEGEVSLEELGELFPDVTLEDRSMLEKMDRFIETALQRARYKKLSDLTLPDTETLIARLRTLSHELISLQHDASLYREAFEKLCRQIETIDLDSKDVAITAIEALQNRVHKRRLDHTPSDHTEHLLTTDTLLRLMMAQVHIQPSGEEFYIEGDTSILESALSAGLPFNYGCSNGNCGKCKSKLISGEIRQTRPYDYVLSQEEKNNDTFLSCCHTATTDIIIETDIAGHSSDIPEQNIAANIKKIEDINHHMQRLKLRTPRTQRLRFLAGQTARLKLPTGAEESFSIASCPCDDMNIEFHIPIEPTNQFFQELQTCKNSDKVEVTGPQGNFVLDYHDTRPLVMIAVDDRFASIKSLIEHAVTLESAEFIHLYWLISSPEQHYLDNVCRAWADAFEQFRYNVLPVDFTQSTSLTEIMTHITTQHPADEESVFYMDAAPSQYEPMRAVFNNAGIETERLHFNN